LLALREHSLHELQRKLSPHAQSEQELTEALAFLQAKGFINEARVVESVIHRRAAKLGASRVRQELQAKGLDAEAVSQAVQTLRSTELERARALWQRKFGQITKEPKERAKQIRYLVSRGFEMTVVSKIVGGHDDD
jgi:regulatory protein